MKILSVYFKGHFIGGFSLLNMVRKRPKKTLQRTDNNDHFKI